MAVEIRSFIYVLNVVVSGSKIISSRLQPYRGNITRSPGLVDNKICRLLWMSSASLSIEILLVIIWNSGGNPHPVPKNDFMVSLMIILLLLHWGFPSQSILHVK